MADTIWSGPSALDNIRAFSQGVAPGWYQAAPSALDYSPLGGEAFRRTRIGQFLMKRFIALLIRRFNSVPDGLVDLWRSPSPQPSPAGRGSRGEHTRPACGFRRLTGIIHRQLTAPALGGAPKAAREGACAPQKTTILSALTPRQRLTPQLCNSPAGRGGLAKRGRVFFCRVLYLIPVLTILFLSLIHI